MRMTYFVFGTSDMEASIKFYDALFAQSELEKLSATDRMTYWIGDDFAFSVAIPFDGKPATNGNGTMVGFDVGSVNEVKRLHRMAIELGGTDEGGPNQRGPNFSAYVRDLDGNKICLFKQGAN